MVKSDNQKQNRYADIAIIFVVSLIPLIWIWGGYVILGHDAGKPLDPQMHFLDRLNTWTHRYGIGADQTFAIAGFFIHGYEYILSKLGLSLSLQQGIEYITYFMAIGYSMYSFVRKIFPNNRYAPIAAALFYEINHFVLQGWFIVERTKFSLYIALPLILLQIIGVNSGTASPLRAGIITSFILLVLNGGGFLPLYGSLFLVVTVFISMLWLNSGNKKVCLTNFGKYFGVTVIFSILFQSYWLFPYAYYIYRDFGSEISKYGGGSVEQWIASISEFASYANMMRLQGIQEWYVNPQHPYAKFFLNNIFLIIISYLLPLAAFGSILVSRLKDRYILVTFGILAIVSMLFMAGSHPPLGSLYLLLVKYLPGFIAFRTPFYKFAPGLWLSYAILIGYTINYLFSIKFPKTPAPIVYLLIVVAILGYSFPIFGTNFFVYGKNLTNRVKVPNYVYEYGRWSQSPQNTFNRILILPPHAPGSLATNLEWGYWSLAPINSLLDPGSYIDQNLTYSAEEAQIVNSLYRKIEQNDSGWLQMAKLLNIDGVLLQKDFVPYSVNDKPVKSSNYEKLIANHVLGKPIVFGKWEVHRILKRPNAISTATGYYLVSDKNDNTNDVIQDRIISISEPNSIILPQGNAMPELRSLKIADVVVPECENCLLMEQIIGPQDHNITNLPGSRLYFLKSWLESYQIKHAGSNIKKAEVSTFQITKRLYEYDNMYVFNLPLFKKHATLDLYSQNITQLKSLLEVINKVKTNPEDKELIIKIHNTLLMHRHSLSNYIENDYDPELTEKLVALDQKISSVIDLISTRYIFSTDINLKKYSFNIQSPGDYDVFLYTPSVSVEKSNEPTIEFRSGVWKESIALDRSKSWQNIGTFPFTQETNTVQIEENDTEIVLSETSPLLANIDKKYRSSSPLTNVKATSPCLVIPLGSLNREKYLFDLQLGADQDTKIWTFLIDNKNALSRVDREHGQYMKVRKDRPLDIKLKFQIEQPEYFSYHVCQFDQKNRISNPIKISKLRVSRITSPMLYFIKKNAKFVSNDPRKVQTISSSNTKYVFDLSSGESQFLVLDQRYNHNWVFVEDSKQTPAIKINGYQNGWVLEKSVSGSNNTVKYVIQDIFIFLSFISLMSVTLAMIFIRKSK